MPGVGVAPFGKGLPGLAGMPGVGVAPFGGAAAFAAGIPGVALPDGATGEPESPGGISFGSILVTVLAELAPAFGALADWHAIRNESSEQVNTNKNFLVIKLKTSTFISFKIAVPV